ncbi:hypothetical protein LB553_06055 [Mesorhizobium sp. CA8]|uniref:hypothetical protein n=1 Tax=Mesorhizobium sp. CA8 TaxID=2876637 RepID=UPI001CCAC94F|nr:hypothetical protein [Mesorhizobium sp. CA8]MBZ9760439.1 hypothetical protein [Mesorhizobium sp. CA8]
MKREKARLSESASQIEKFREAARVLKSVGDEEYDNAVARVAKAEKLTPEQIKELARRKRDEAKD